MHEIFRRIQSIHCQKDVGWKWPVSVLILESRTIAEDVKGEWLRMHGLHSEHLPLWEQELAHRMADKEVDIKSVQQENKNLKNELKKAKKETDQLEKALTEMSALYALKKKAESIWGDKEDD